AVGRGRPNWISQAGEDLSITVSALPTRQDVDANINEQLIVELYSK
nr:30S ribosomal protein S4 [Acidobacteriota bacterium]